MLAPLCAVVPCVAPSRAMPAFRGSVFPTASADQVPIQCEFGPAVCWQPQCVSGFAASRQAVQVLIRRRRPPCGGASIGHTPIPRPGFPPRLHWGTFCRGPRSACRGPGTAGFRQGGVQAWEVSFFFRGGLEWNVCVQTLALVVRFLWRVAFHFDMLLSSLRTRVQIQNWCRSVPRTTCIAQGLAPPVRGVRLALAPSSVAAEVRLRRRCRTPSPHRSGLS